MKKRALPQIIQEHGFDFRWDNKKVWALDYPVEEMPVTELEWILEIPFWPKEGGFYDLTAREVIDFPDKHNSHIQRLDKCDTSYPIDIMLNKKGNWLILDGLHRLVKLVMDGATVINVRKIPRGQINNILKD